MKIRSKPIYKLTMVSITVGRKMVTRFVYTKYENDKTEISHAFLDSMLKSFPSPYPKTFSIA